MKYKIAIVGATGNVGREILKILYERQFPTNDIYVIASEQSKGQQVYYGDNQQLTLDSLDNFDFKKIDIAFFSSAVSVSKKFVPIAAKAGCIVIDNTSCFRMNPEVPLIIPEVNPDSLLDYKKTNIIANPNCATIQMLVALKPLHDDFKIKRIVITTYQSTSGAGKEAMEELSNQSKALCLNNSVQIEQKAFTKQIAFNAIPHIDIFTESGATKEEEKIEQETQKILSTDIKVHANCARIGSFVGHAEYINIETEIPISEISAKEVLSNGKGIKIADSRKDGGYLTPIECVGKNEVFISRIRKDYSTQNGLSFWCTSDNLRKGAALNAIQIAEMLVNNYFDTPYRVT